MRGDVIVSQYSFSYWLYLICVRCEGVNVYYCIVYNISHSIFPLTREIILIGRAFNVFSNLRKCITLHIDNFVTTHSSPAGCWSGSKVSTNYRGGKMRGNESTMLPDHNSRDLYNNWLFMHMW